MPLKLNENMVTDGLRQQFSGPTIALGAVTLAALGLAAGLLLGPDPIATRAAETTTAETDVPVVTEVFDDLRQVPFESVWGPESTIVVADTGRITRAECEIGEPIESGSSPLSVDDRPSVALATTAPLWRDLGPGMQGDDVLSVQAELDRLGFAVQQTGTYDAATAAAVQELFHAAGEDRLDGSLPMSRVVWLPDAHTVSAQCPPIVGLESAAGTDAVELARTDSPLVALRATGAGLDGAAYGAREVRLGDLTAPVDDTGRVTDPEFLSVVNEIGAFNLEAGFSTIELDLSLTDPRTVTVVPASAVFGLTGNTGCIMADGVPQQVEVVASRLGRTMLDLGPGSATPSVVQLPTADQPCP